VIETLSGSEDPAQRAVAGLMTKRRPTDLS
jgi:hypothetical protein